MALSMSAAFRPTNYSELQMAATAWCTGDRTTYPDIERWDVSLVTSFREIFYSKNGACVKFNANLSSWDTAKMTDMRGMFHEATAFNGDLSSWDTAKVTNMVAMFYGAIAFHGDLSSWDTGQVTDMS